MKALINFGSLIFLISFLGSPLWAKASCADLASLALPDARITLARSVAAGSFTLPDRVPNSSAAPVFTNATFPPPAALAEVPFKDLPAFCRVVMSIRPSKDSDISVEIWMPLSGWNGKLMAVGNGGWAGAIAYPEMSAALARGYATTSTDTGHKGTNGDASFALGHPEKVIDFGYRSVHEMTLKAKATITAFYGNAPKLSYWNGCSTGGKEGLKEAQMFPTDFNAIVAGAPSNNWTHLNAQFIWVAQAMHKDEASYIPPAKYSLIHDAVLRACDAQDGVKDGVLEDPTRCKFDPKVLECKGPDGTACLTAPQVDAARAVYSPATNPRTKQQIYPGLMPGSELGWAAQAGPQPGGIPYGYFKYVVFKDPNWDYKMLNFDGDIALADQADNGIINATDPNLQAFFAHGGKLLQYHGWGDNQISPLNSIDYYNRVVGAMGGADKVKDSYRLFMIPGMPHCRADARIPRGGDGLNSFDSISVMEQWVEGGKPPDRIVASRVANGVVEQTRPLCPYPQIASYKGTGSTNDAANFACRVPQR
jgi:feruloyl esterase